MTEHTYTVKAQYFIDGVEVGSQEGVLSHEGAIHLVRETISTLVLAHMHGMAKGVEEEHARAGNSG